MNLSLLNKQAVVAGSTQGIGKAIAVELANLGASVTLLARNEEALKKVLAELNISQNQKHDYLVADFANSEDLKTKIYQYASQKEAVHILINNTGGPPAGNIFEADVQQFLNGFSAHIICNQHLSQALVPLMKKEGYGRIINIISTSVKVPIAGLGVSNTIRGAVANWAKTLATELAPFGITVNNILPGYTKTARLDSLMATRAKGAGISAEEYSEKLKATIPVRRFGEAEEIAYAAAFLASPSAAFITGINLPVDGGNTPCL
ncbi:SDR family oxidoreductase [Thermoflexibacter ruber]|uniref:3-oxoacyl-[acyl-carrier protein] reductase n=1 Tax=Thermoflexibacter ruber TaxID=1003 RepID=A0A1I2B0Z2_9BACT|nr:SDR family oxidoreductase [Thermoflexibacter ruber]SFE49845.1 3-oxoacyl-[acyl-carrier protein] reductase [Thermoflexibacter ruber]